MVLDDNIDENLISLSVKKLWSPHDLERERGKEEILRIGGECVEQLLVLLVDLVDNPHPRFAIGKEREAIKLLRDHSKNACGGMSSSEFDRWTQATLDLFINSRLITDAIYLLGKLRAVEAIPVLIRIMEGRSIFQDPDGWGDEMIALSRIGSPAVPYLMATIQNAKATAERQEDIHLGWEIQHAQPDCDLSQEGNEAMSDEDIEEEQDEVRIRFRKIQERSIMVLSEIGDHIAWSYLRRLMLETRDQALFTVIAEALDKIARKPDDTHDDLDIQWTILPREQSN